MLVSRRSAAAARSPRSPWVAVAICAAVMTSIPAVASGSARVGESVAARHVDKPVVFAESISRSRHRVQSVQALASPRQAPTPPSHAQPRSLTGMLGVRASVSQAPRATVLAGSPGLQSAPGFAGEPDPTGCGSPCSDPVVPIAVGPGVVVQVGPSGFRFFNKGGELLLKLGYPDFFGISATGSPKIVYDQLHGRWVAAATDPSACANMVW